MIARVLVAANLLAFAGALAVASGWQAVMTRFVAATIFVEPLVLISIAALAALSPLLARLRYAWGAVCTVAVVLACAALVQAATAPAQPEAPAHAAGSVLLLSGMAAAAMLGYFRLFARAHSPAIAEARLQALQARIRPHFLFNSLNAVLALIRRDPQRAEQSLEDLADLFRTLMSDARQFVHLADEIELLERYASIEQLRLGERLRITWDLDGAPGDATLPPLVLQPLLENAVYHGVEPAIGVSDVLVQIRLRGQRLLVRIDNPVQAQQAHRAGNRMALENIRERLTLFFDAEARIDVRTEGDRYVTELEIPYRPASAARPANAARGDAGRA